MRDYYVSATVRPKEVVWEASLNWSLWVQRFKAESVLDARNAAVKLIEQRGFEYGQLDILWDDSYARKASDILAGVA